MRIGIYGGSFNPIHKGHVMLASALLQKGDIDELWLLVSPLNPLKQSSAADIVSLEHRLRMAERATADMDGVKVSDFESHLPIPSYTIRTLAALDRAYPQHSFTLVIGADNWECFPQWYQHDEIVEKYDVLVYRRPGCILDESALPQRVKAVETPLYDISSTQIRKAVSEGNEEMLKEWIDEKVRMYIAVHRLYVNR